MTPKDHDNVGGSRRRRIGVAILIWGTTLLAVIAIFAVWSNRQVFNSDNWADTSSRLLQNDEIRATTANLLVEKLYGNVDVDAALKERLPENLKPLAGPIAGGLQTAAVAAAHRALAGPRAQEVWKRANRAADEQFIAIAEGREGNLSTTGGAVTLDLTPILMNLSERLGLPDISTKLPPAAGHVTILKADNLELVQNGTKALKGLALLLTIIVPLLYALAIFLARGRRRRTLMSVGFAIISAGVVVLAGRALIESQTINSLVKNDANVPAAKAVMSIATSMLSEIAGAFVIVGIPLVVAAWFAGPAGLAVKARERLAPFLRDEPVWTYGIVTAVMLLIFIWRPIPATGKPAGVIVFLGLAWFGTEVLRRQTAREYPASAPQVPRSTPRPEGGAP